MAIQATFWTIFFGACGGVYIAWMANAKMIDNHVCGHNSITELVCDTYDAYVYDNLCRVYPLYTDNVKALEYQKDILNWDYSTQ